MTVNFSHYKGINRKLTDAKKVILAEHARYLLQKDTTLLSNARDALKKEQKTVAGIFKRDLPVLKQYGLCRQTKHISISLALYEPGETRPTSPNKAKDMSRRPACVGEWSVNSFSSYLQVFEDNHSRFEIQKVELVSYILAPSSMHEIRFSHGPTFEWTGKEFVRFGPTDDDLAAKPWLGWHIDNLSNLVVPEGLQKKIHAYVRLHHEWATELRQARLDVMRFIDRTDKFADILKHWPQAADVVDQLFPLTDEAMAEKDPLKTARKFMKSATPEAA